MLSWLKNLLGMSRDDEPALREFEITVVRGVAVIRIPEAPTAEEAKRAADEVVARGLEKRRLWDFSGIPFPYSNQEVRALAEYGASIVRVPNRVAILVDDDIGYGSGRVFGAFREDGNLSQTRVFQDREEALSWLTEEI